MLTKVLAAYGLTDAKATLLRHNENQTWRVDGPDGRYVLRIHQPKEGMSVAAFDGGISPVELRRTEMAFLRHLAAKGLPVQRPVPNRQGDDVTLLPGGVCATLLTWLEGEDLSSESLTPENCRALGALAYRLHAAARDFHPAAVRRYDAVHCRQTADVISGLSLPEDDKAVLTQALDRIGSIWESRADAALMIHTDLSCGNLLSTVVGFAPIDFSLGGMGHPMFDLAVLAAAMPSAELADVCKAGYADAGGVLDEAAYTAGFALGVIDMIALFGDNMVSADWFPDCMARWRDQLFLPLLNDIY